VGAGGGGVGKGTKTSNQSFSSCVLEAMHSMPVYIIFTDLIVTKHCVHMQLVDLTGTILLQKDAVAVKAVPLQGAVRGGTCVDALACAQAAALFLAENAFWLKMHSSRRITLT
jgi:hypothetical protein